MIIYFWTSRLFIPQYFTKTIVLGISDEIKLLSRWELNWFRDNVKDRW